MNAVLVVEAAYDIGQDFLQDIRPDLRQCPARLAAPGDVGTDDVNRTAVK